MQRTTLEHYLSDLLTPNLFQDYCPNGLQIEGAETLHKIAFAVSATSDSIHQAGVLQADALVVHHGLFWHFHGPKVLSGSFAKRVFPLVRKNINLFAYHLPLDAHPEIGNAASLGNMINCGKQKPFGDYKGRATGIQGELDPPITVTELAATLQNQLNHAVIVASPAQTQMINSVGIITGGANSDWVLAKQAGLDAYITGEISEHDWHEAQENGIHMFAAGHHATERPGIISLMNRVQTRFSIECLFIDSNNPV